MRPVTPSDQPLTPAVLLSTAEQIRWCDRLIAWGYRAHLVSSQSGAGVAELRERLSQPGIAVLCGPSGVGKSSLLNALVPELALRVSAVSGRLQRGRHTTRHVELFPLAPGALLADSPGFNRPDLPVDPAALAVLFPEIRELLSESSCRFKNCLHQGDPGCAVGVDWDRHPLYLNCLEAAQQQAAREPRPRSGPDSAGLKQRGSRQEPLLDQRLRSESRRRRRQSDVEEP